MSVHLIIMTHGKIGQALLAATTHTIGQLPIPTTTLSVHRDSDAQKIKEQLQQLLVQLNCPGGILILTDLYGATPCNIARNFAKQDDVRVVSGINLPMLMKVMNYPQLSLNELVLKATSGGAEGIVECESN